MVEELTIQIIRSSHQIILSLWCPKSYINWPFMIKLIQHSRDPNFRFEIFSIVPEWLINFQTFWYRYLGLPVPPRLRKCWLSKLIVKFWLKLSKFICGVLVATMYKTFVYKIENFKFFIQNGEINAEHTGSRCSGQCWENVYYRVS